MSLPVATSAISSGMPQVSGDIKSQAPSTIIGDQQNYWKSLYTAGKYAYKRVAPNTGGNDFTLSATSTTDKMFTIDYGVINPSRCDLSYNRVFALPSGTAAAHYNVYEHTEGIINALQLGDNNNAKCLMDLQNASYLLRLLRMYNTSMEDFLGQSQSDRLYPIRTNGAAGQDGQYVDGTAANSPFTEVRQYLAGASNADLMSTKVCIPMRAFVHSFFSLDKDIYLPCPLTFTVTFDRGTSLGWANTSSLVPATGATAIDQNLSITDLWFNVASQMDPDINAKVKARFESGADTAFQFTTYNETQIANGTSQNVSVDLSATKHGKYLQRIYYSCFNDTDTLNTRYDCANVAGATQKITSYQTKLNGLPEQPTIVNCSATGNDSLGDYRMHRRFLKGTPITGPVSYQENWVHASIYDGFMDDTDRLKVAKDNLIGGIDIMSTPVKWSIEATMRASAAFRHRVFIVCLKRFAFDKMAKAVIVQ